MTLKEAIDTWNATYTCKWVSTYTVEAEELLWRRGLLARMAKGFKVTTVGMAAGLVGTAK